MNTISYILLAVVLLAFLFVARLIYKGNARKSCCASGCSDCSCCTGCK